MLIIHRDCAVPLFFDSVLLGERSSFVVSLVLAMALFLTSSIDLMPDSSEVIPLFSYFLGLVLLAMFLDSNGRTL